MRISLYSGSTIYPLAGASGVSERTHSSAAGFELTPESEVQIAAFVRGVYAKPIDRGNLLNVMSFTTSRLFATPAEAQLWCLDYHSGFPSSGVLYLDAISPGGYITRRTMANAVVDPPRRRCNGATALVDYTVRGGVIAPESSYADMDVTGSFTSNGSTPVTFPHLLFAGFYGGKPVYTNNGLVTGFTHSMSWESTVWLLGQVSPPCAWISASAVATPDLATGWIPLGSATGTPTISAI